MKADSVVALVAPKGASRAILIAAAFEALLVLKVWNNIYEFPTVELR